MAAEQKKLVGRLGQDVYCFNTPRHRPSSCLGGSSSSHEHKFPNELAKKELQTRSAVVLNWQSMSSSGMSVSSSSMSSWVGNDEGMRDGMSLGAWEVVEGYMDGMSLGMLLTVGDPLGELLGVAVGASVASGSSSRFLQPQGSRKMGDV